MNAPPTQPVLFDLGERVLPQPTIAATHTGTVVDVFYPRKDTGLHAFRVIAVELDGSAGTTMTWVGEMPPVKVGMRLQAVGTVEQDRRRGGEQLKVSSAIPVVEQTTDGILAYLGGGAIPHIGEVMAKRIVTRFGEATLTILDRTPERLAEVPGIKPGSPKLARIIAAWIEGRGKCVALMWFAAHCVSVSLAKRIVDEYGPAAVAIVEKNPFRLAAEVDGIGFARADEIAQKLGIASDSPVRACAALLHALAEASGKGHCFLPEHEMVTTAARLIQRPEAALREVLRLITTEEAETIHGRAIGPVVCLGRLAEAEKRVAKRVLALLAARPANAKLAGLTTASATKAITAFERESGMTLAPVQRDAVLLAATSPMMILTGGPGTGKTQITKTILAFFNAHELNVILMSPTGKAAKRMNEVTGHPAATIHATLGARPNSRKFGFDLTNPLPADVVILDEGSMMDISIAAAVFEAVGLGKRIILVGDVDQLPSVAPGAVLHDLIASGVVPTVRLTQVFRQAKGSSILSAAHAINHGQLPVNDEGPSGEFYMLPANGGSLEQDEVADLVVRLATDRIPGRRSIPSSDVLVLTPMHKMEAGTIALNERLRAVMNPPDPGKRELQRGEKLFREGDRVMQKRNDSFREIFNGDVGTILSIRDATQDDPTIMTVLFDGREVSYVSKEVSYLRLAYAVSIHAAQGSEAPAVVVVLHRAHTIMASRKLIYTAVTRAKKLCMVVTDQRTMRLALSETRKEVRNTLLAERLRGEIH